MKKTSKIMAMIMAVIMVVSLFPMTVFAADLSKAVNAVTDSDYYNVSLTNDGGDFINFEFQGVSQDGTMTVDANTPITIVMSDGSGYINSSSLTTLGWHYGANSYSYCLSTDEVTTMTDGTYSFAVSGFGSKMNANNTYARSGQSMATTLTLEDGLPAGVYTFTVSYRFQMKKNESLKWKAKYELSSTDTITITSVAAEEPEVHAVAQGGSIRVGDVPGLRFGFKTADVAAEDIEEYGFLYVYDDVEALSPETEGVHSLVASNHITHNEGAEDEYTTFNLVFTKVPSDEFNTKITACSYVVIGGETFYSEPVTRSFNQVAQAILADDAVEESVKDAVSALLNA